MRTTARRSPRRLTEEILRPLPVLAGAYGDIFFIRNPWFGALVLFCTFLVPDIGVHGLLAGLCALGIIRALNTALLDSLFARVAACNSVLMGLYFGSLYKLSPAGLLTLFTAVLAILAVTNLVMGALAKKNLPALSLPFSLVGFVVFWWVKAIGPLIHSGPYLTGGSVPGGVSAGAGLFAAAGNTLGSILFLPGALAGMGILVFLLLYSRLQFLLVCYGLFLAVLSQGIFYTLLPGPAHYSTPFNLVLTSIALGGIFIAFSRASLAVATAGILFAVAVEGAYYRFFSFTGDISPLTFPFCISTVLLLDFVRSHRPQWLPARTARDIETTASLHRSRRERFGDETPVLGLPLLREAAVLQGVDGEWTHVGPWRFALDFFITDPPGSSHRPGAAEAADYHVFGAEVVSPCDGEVVRVENEHPDQKLGLIDLEYNWGNYVMIRTPAGRYVLLSHLQRGSAKVKVGSWVYAEQPVALVGNSGHSYEPHLHLQVQESALLGAPTMPFRFKSYQSGGEVHFFTVPRQGERAGPFPPNKTLPYALGLKLGQELNFILEEDGRKIKTAVKVRLDELTGEWFFADEKNGRLSFWSDPRIFYVYDLQCSDESPLNLLMAALPRLPLTFGREYRWKDTLPLTVTNRGPRRLLLELLNPFFKTLARGRLADYTLDASGMRLSGQVLFLNNPVRTLAVIDPLAGIKELRAGRIRLVREEASSASPGARGAPAAG